MLNWIIEVKRVKLGSQGKRQDFDQQWKKLLSNKEKMQKAFAIPLSFSRTCHSKSAVIAQMKSVLASSLQKPVCEFENNRNSQTLLFFGMGTSKRQDHLSGFEKVVDIAQPCDVQRPTAVHGKTSLLYFFQSIIAIVCSVPFALYHHWKLREWLFALPFYISAWHFKNFVKQVEFLKYKLVIVFFDSETCANLLVQMAKENGCKTATLMHGIYVAPQKDPKNPFEDGANFRGFVSDYLLAWNEFDRDQAEKSGIAVDQIKVVGSQKFIDVQAPQKHRKTNSFGVILGWDHDKENRELIEIANCVAANLGMTYYLKYHPLCKGHEYNKLVSKSCIGNIDRTIKVKAYVEQTDFTIVGTSAMFVELLYLNHITYHLHIDGEFDCYAECKDFSFSTAEQVIQHIKTNKVEMLITSQEYLSGPHNVRERYKEFFRKILDS